jgi:hypothetical protein
MGLREEFRQSRFPESHFSFQTGPVVLLIQRTITLDCNYQQKGGTGNFPLLQKERDILPFDQ